MDALMICLVIKLVIELMAGKPLFGVFYGCRLHIKGQKMDSGLGVRRKMPMGGFRQKERVVTVAAGAIDDGE